MDAGGGNPARSRHPSRAPMSSALRHRLQGCDDHRLDFGIVDRARHARTRLVMEAVQPLRDETGSPLAHRLRRVSELSRNHLVRIARCAGEHDAGSQRQSLGRRSPPGQAPQRFLFSLAQSENRQRTTHDPASGQSPTLGTPAATTNLLI
jgi:hypothetical protein